MSLSCEADVAGPCKSVVHANAFAYGALGPVDSTRPLVNSQGDEEVQVPQASVHIAIQEVALGGKAAMAVAAALICVHAGRPGIRANTLPKKMLT